MIVCRWGRSREVRPESVGSCDPETSVWRAGAYPEVSLVHRSLDRVGKLPVRDVNRETGRLKDLHLEVRRLALGDPCGILPDEKDHLVDVL
jgi:hypothetical protein